MTTKSSL